MANLKAIQYRHNIYHKLKSENVAERHLIVSSEIKWSEVAAYSGSPLPPGGWRWGGRTGPWWTPRPGNPSSAFRCILLSGSSGPPGCPSSPGASYVHNTPPRTHLKRQDNMSTKCRTSNLPKRQKCTTAVNIYRCKVTLFSCFIPPPFSISEEKEYHFIYIIGDVYKRI